MHIDEFQTRAPPQSNAAGHDIISVQVHRMKGARLHYNCGSRKRHLKNFLTKIVGTWNKNNYIHKWRRKLKRLATSGILVTLLIRHQGVTALFPSQPSRVNIAPIAPACFTVYRLTSALWWVLYLVEVIYHNIGSHGSMNNKGNRI